jgi:hypothetical protein
MSTIQLLVSFDTTGSMYPCIKQLKHTLKELIDYLFALYPELEIGIISHGDYCDYNYPPTLDWIPFTNNKEALLKYVTTAKATSGGDTDEFYEWIFKRASTLKWKEDSIKIYVPIGDASPHSATYIWKNNSPKIKWEEEVANIISKNIAVVPIQCLRIGYSSRSNTFWEGLAKLSSSPHITLDQFKDVYQLLTAIVLSKMENTEEAERYVDKLYQAKTLSINTLEAFKQLHVSSELIGGLVLEDTSISKYKKRYNSSTISGYKLEPVPEGRFQLLNVSEDTSIKKFVENEISVFKIGRGFYELSKPELIQEYKEVVVRDSIGNLYSGNHARDMINAPLGVRKKVSKLDTPNGWQVFIQSTSLNRKLVKNTQFLYEV